jgi:molybdopterin converting factor small subunit
MNIKVKIFYSELQRRIGNPESITVSGDTVGECLRDLVKRYPGAGELIFDKHSQLLEKVFVFVNAESMYKADLNKTVTATDELILAVLMLGG